MEKRVLVAIGLCFLSLYLWQTFVVKPVPKPAGAGAPAASTSPAIPGTAASTPAAATAAEAVASAGTPPAPAGPPLVGDSEERDVRVETNDLIAVFTNRGARLKSWRLKRYLDPDK